METCKRNESQGTLEFKPKEKTNSTDMSFSTLKRKSLGDCPTPTKKDPARYPLCFILPDAKSQKLIVSWGEKDHALELHVCGEMALDVVTYDGVQVLVTFTTQRSLETVFTVLRQYLRQDADVVIFSQAFMTEIPNRDLGTCRLLDYTESTLKLHLPNFRIDSASSQTPWKFYALSSSLAKDKITGIGLLKCDMEPQHLQQYAMDGWSWHNVAVSVGNIDPKRMYSDDDILKTYLVCGAREVLKRLIESRGDVRMAIYLASDIAVPGSVLSPPDEENLESLEHDHKMILKFFQLIESLIMVEETNESLITVEEIEEFTLFLFDGDIEKYDECLLAALDKPDTVLNQVFLKLRSTAGKDLDLFRLKYVLDQMKSKKFIKLFNNLFLFNVHHLDYAC